jgi:hypothetical protein
MKQKVRFFVLYLQATYIRGFSNSQGHSTHKKYSFVRLYTQLSDTLMPTNKDSTVDGSSKEQFFFIYIWGKSKHTRSYCLVWPIQLLGCQVEPLWLHRTSWRGVKTAEISVAEPLLGQRAVSVCSLNQRNAGRTEPSIPRGHSVSQLSHVDTN